MPTVIHGLRGDLFRTQFSADNRYTVITESKLKCDAYNVDLIATIREEVWDIPSRNCSDHFMDMMLELPGIFVNADGSEYIFSDALIEERRYFWRDTIQTPEPRHTPLGLRTENRQFLIETGSILIAKYPATGALLGKRPANDR